jgi:FAD/FMN-containing dehydrogenase
MNNILSFDNVSGIVTVEAGVILQQLETFLDAKGYSIPLDLGAKGRYKSFSQIQFEKNIAVR